MPMLMLMLMLLLLLMLMLRPRLMLMLMLMLMLLLLLMLMLMLILMLMLRLYAHLPLSPPCAVPARDLSIGTRRFRPPIPPSCSTSISPWLNCNMRLRFVSRGMRDPALCSADAANRSNMVGIGNILQ